MDILVIGTGAVGGYYGGKLANAGFNVRFLARGKTYDALSKKPLFVKSYEGDFAVQLSAIPSLQNIPPPDFILVAVKSYDTDTIIPLLQPVVGKNTTIISFQNGVENEIKLGHAFGKEKVLGCVCYIGAEMTEPGLIHHTAHGSVSIGEMNGQVTTRLQEIVDACKKSEIHISLSTSIQTELWGKLLWNTAFNQVCTIARADVGRVLDYPKTRELLEQTMREVLLIAKAHQIDIADSTIDMHMTFSESQLRPVRPSMLQDLEKNRRLEHETFSGFIVREGQRLNIPVPINQVLYQLLSFLNPKH